MIIGTKKRTKEGEQAKPTRFYSAAQENAVSKAFDKGDVVTSGKNSFLLECKTKITASESISIKKDWFEKNRQECLLTGTPHQAIVFNFGPDEENHYIIDEYLFLELLNHLNTLEEDI